MCRYLILSLVSVCLALSGCAYTSPRSPGFGQQLRENIAANVRSKIDLAHLNPVPPNLLVMRFYYDGGVLKDPEVIQSSGDASIDVLTAQLVLSADIPRLVTNKPGVRTRYIVNFCFYPQGYICSQMEQGVNNLKIERDYDRLHGEPAGVADPSGTNQ